MTVDPNSEAKASVPWFGGGIWRESARALDSYGLLLIIILIDYILMAIPWSSGWAIVIRAVLVAVTAVLGVHTSNVRGVPLRIVVIIAAVAIIAAFVAVVVNGEVTRGLVYVAVAFLALVTPIAVLARVVQQREVTAQTILGAVCAYVLFGLMFAYVDHAIRLISGRFFAQPGVTNESAFVYFSFITLTTVGYGDLSPTTGLPRSMAVSEALIGQIFLVILVARLVAAYNPQSWQDRRRTLIQTRATRSLGSGPDPGQREDDEE